MIVEMTSVTPVDVTLDYAQYEQVLHLAEGLGAAVASTDFTDRVVLHLVFRSGEELPFCEKMLGLRVGREGIWVVPAHFAEFTRQ